MNSRAIYQPIRALLLIGTIAAFAAPSHMRAQDPDEAKALEQPEAERHLVDTLDVPIVLDHPLYEGNEDLFKLRLKLYSDGQFLGTYDTLSTLSQVNSDTGERITEVRAKPKNISGAYERSSGLLRLLIVSPPPLQIRSDGSSLTKVEIVPMDQIPICPPQAVPVSDK